MLTCVWLKKKTNKKKHWSSWTLAHNGRVMFIDPDPQTHQQQNNTQTKNSEGTFADRHALWDIKKALLTNPPSSTNKSHWFPNNTSPWMHSPTSSAQPHTSTINNLHNKRPLCVKAYSLGIIVMMYSVGITYWQLILIYTMQHVAVIAAYTASSVGSRVYKSLLCRWRASWQKHSAVSFPYSSQLQ